MNKTPESVWWPNTGKACSTCKHFFWMNTPALPTAACKIRHSSSTQSQVLPGGGIPPWAICPFHAEDPWKDKKDWKHDGERVITLKIGMFKKVKVYDRLEVIDWQRPNGGYFQIWRRELNDRLSDTGPNRACAYRYPDKKPLPEGFDYKALES